MRGILALLCATAALYPVASGAQSSKQTTTSKISIKDGRDVKVTGCVGRWTSEGESGFVLTSVADKRGALHSYVLVSDEPKQLAQHIGHLVEIKGEATDRGDAKVKIETSTERTGDRETHAKTTAKGDLPQMVFLGVKSVKLVAGACPDR